MSIVADTEDLKLIRLTGAVDQPDDPSYPYKLEVNLRPPELMQVTFIMLHGGSEVIVVRGKTRAAIDRFIDQNDLRQHPRLRRMSLSGPGSTREEIAR
jgi:hypothetical protein